ncbi:NADH:flavin oxidoreductase [Paraliobacillus quinghaiensis]|uniref:NADH:flavin oxidoreductase n=1 Tax=Paraliobacillus quinghaiensis TaxID=470815 RepID=A0A917WZM8_9BACI|nr:FAD-dependent oxidoreductase [Paraliobacillus quinghaiensis]GGM43502.1 NADH:flavin oxidoreductase [Paraliobacillus quinghaiensis]
MDNQPIFKEGKIGDTTLKNRIIMPGMGTNLGGPNGEITDQLIRYYQERAKGGTALLITEFTTIDYDFGKGAINQLRIDKDDFIPGLERLVSAVHKYDAKIFVQLHHAGRESNSALLGGQQIVAPSPVTCEAIGEVPRELTTAEVKELVDKFVAGAVRCQLAGADGVELHGAHGYLINQFLSPTTNLRTDQYGGNFENRMRFVEEIVIGIKKACGASFPVTIRLSIDEFDTGGMDIALSKKVCRYLERIGVDGIHASAGNYNSMDKMVESPLYEQGWRVYLAEAIKNEVSIPVITVGSIRESKFVSALLADGKADFVAIGRGLIADPEWVNKVYQGREQEIRMCISCLHCVYSQTHPHVTCSINVRAGRELEYDNLEKTSEKRHVVIVGGGPGGMEAARILTLRGYGVTLFEKGDKLGGQLNLVTEPTYKKKMQWYIDYFINEMKRLNIDIRLKTEVTVNMIKSLEPYAVILATGGQPRDPGIKGQELDNVCNYHDVKLERKLFNDKKIAVLGSGMVCHSVIRKLREQGNDVSLIELPTKSGNKISPPTRARLLERLRKNNVEIITGYKVVEIFPNSIVIEEKETGKQMELDVDQVVIAMGVMPYNPLEESMRKQFDNVFVIGDAAGHVSLADATTEGFEIGACHFP